MAYTLIYLMPVILLGSTPSRLGAVYEATQSSFKYGPLESVE